MEIFYINIEEFKKNHNKDFLMPYQDIELKNEKRFYEYCLGRFLVKNIAKQKYNIEDTEIVVKDNGKPVFKNADLFFSISHSKNIVIACFDKYPCAIDIEYIKERNFKKLSDFYNREFSSKEEFYKFWTLKEASYKLGEKVEESCFEIFKDEYYLAVVSGRKNIKIDNLSAMSIP